MKKVFLITLVLYATKSLVAGQSEFVRDLNRFSKNLSGEELNALQEFGKALQGQEFEKAGLMLNNTLMPMVITRKKKLNEELSKAEHKDQTQQIEARPTAQMNALSDLAQAITDALQPGIEAYEKRSIKALDALAQKLPAWIQEEQTRENTQTKNSLESLWQKWSSLLAIVSQSELLKGVAFVRHIMLPYQKILHIEQRAQQRFMHAFLNKQGW